MGRSNFQYKKVKSAKKKNPQIDGKYSKFKRIQTLKILTPNEQQCFSKCDVGYTWIRIIGVGGVNVPVKDVDPCVIIQTY